MKYLDMYGQSIKFTYRKSGTYGTTCGIITSVIVVVIILVYIVLYCVDIAEMNKPTVLNVPQNLNIAPLYTFYSDTNALLSIDSEIPALMTNESNKSYQMLILGLKNKTNFEWVEFSEAKLGLTVTQKEKNSKDGGEPLYVDKCRRFPFIDNSVIDLYDLTKVLCIYSPFKVSGDLVSSDYTYLEINLIKDCNATEINNKNAKAFNNLKNIYPIGITEHYKLMTESPTSDISLNYDFYFMYLDTIFNHTSLDHPLIPYLDWKSFELGEGLMASVSVYFQKNILETFRKIVPKALSSSNTSEHYISFDQDKFKNSPASNSINNQDTSISIQKEEPKTLVQILVKSSDRINHYERTYATIFDILGKIGGFAQIVFLIGSFFVIYSGVIRLRESFINDVYSVIDPEKTEKVNKKFIDYLDEIGKNIEENDNKEKTENKKENKISKENKNKNKEEKMKNFFLHRRNDLIEISKKIENNELSFKEKAKFYICKILYETQLNKIYSGMHYSTGEMFLNFFCCCCPPEMLRRKNKVYRKALKALEKDTDFRTILECVQNFESIKEIFLKRETQLSLFKSMANKPFYGEDEPEQSKNSKEDETMEESSDEEENLKTLYDNLMYFAEDEKNEEEHERNKKLILNLAGENYKKDAENLNEAIDNLFRKRQESEKEKKEEKKKKSYRIKKEDLEKINEEFLFDN